MTKSIFLQRLSTTVQFILGFFLGISLIAGISGTIIFAYYKKMSVLPKKPIFSEVASTTTSKSQKNTTTEIEPVESNTLPNEQEQLETTSANNLEELELPANAYRAVVTWPEGLSLRAEPEQDAERIGGIAYQQNIIVLEDTTDGQWQRVKIPESEQEGWVKGGNTERTSD
ncbi:SH3 type 3 domain-containing protein [Chondrocystis sp. NIES-4102]|nr:SH3 type 3 domain-containing protein [Chondrocystis sp. NIES-4102]